MEELQTQGWDGGTQVSTYFLGSPLCKLPLPVWTTLMHDFCAISLSDLLTPWQVIEKRLAAAAEADFDCFL